MNLQEIIQDEFDKMTGSGDLEAEIREQARKVIKSSVETAFKSWGGISKQVESAVEDALKLDFSALSIPEYNTMIVQMVKAIALEHLESEAQGIIAERLSDLLKPVPTEIALQELLNEFLEIWKDEGCICSDRANLEIEHNDWSENSSTIKLWREPPSNLYSSRSTPDVSLYISNGKIRIPRLDMTRLPSKWSFNIDARIYQMFCAGTLITDVHDHDADDFSVSYYDD